MRIFIFPFLLDFIAFLSSMRVADAAGREMHISNLQAALLVVAFCIGYMVSCVVAGHILTRRNSRNLLVTGVVGMLLVSIPIFYCNSFLPIAAMMLFRGVALALCFNSFQTYMRGEAPVGSLGRTISRYTISWSSGIAFGFLCGGLLKTMGGPPALAAASTLSCLIILALVATHDQTHHEEDSVDGRLESIEEFHPDDEVAGARALALHTRYAVVGWSLCLFGNLAMRPIGTYMPKFLAEQGHQPWLAGALLFSLYILQALVGSVAYRFRHWHFRRGPLMVQQGLLLACFAGLWHTANLLGVWVILMLMGVLNGFNYFWSVYYASNHPESSRIVGVNEAMVGVGSILGAMLSEAVITQFHSETAYCPMVMLSIALLMIAQWFWLEPVEPSPQSALPLRAKGLPDMPGGS